jgi:hypothetical protein
LRTGNRAVAGKRGNSRTIAPAEGLLSTVSGENGKERKTLRAAIPMFNEAFETEGAKSLAANRPDVCAVYRCHTLNSGLALRTDPRQQFLTANSDRLSHFGRRMSLFPQTLVLRGICFASRSITKNTRI